MYTDIKTDAAHASIPQYLQAELCTHRPNPSPKYSFIVKFGDTHWRQISRTGMGIVPAPPTLMPFMGVSFSLNGNNISYYTRGSLMKSLVSGSPTPTVVQTLHSDPSSLMTSSFGMTLNGLYPLNE
ncbi:hypothetical protein ACHAW6_015174 [Cyclotella cf. meneghiniana]